MGTSEGGTTVPEPNPEAALPLLCTSRSQLLLTCTAAGEVSLLLEGCSGSSLAATVAAAAAAAEAMVGAGPGASNCRIAAEACPGAGAARTADTQPRAVDWIVAAMAGAASRFIVSSSTVTNACGGVAAPGRSAYAPWKTLA